MSDKKFSITDLSKDGWKTIKVLDTEADPYTQRLYDYQKQMLDDLYKKYLGTNLCKEITIPTTTNTPPVTHKPPSNTNIVAKNSPAQTTMSYTDLIKLMNQHTTYNTYPSTKSWGEYDTYFKSAPMVSRYDKKVEVQMEDGSIESISREELIKYISEQRVVRENEMVRKVYERYQVAVKLVRSDDNGDTGV